MWKRLGQVSISKPAALAVILLVAVMPWFRGGKDPIGWMVLLGVGLLGSFIAWRSPSSQVKLGRLAWAWLALITWTALSLIWTVNRFQTISWLILWVFIGIVFILARTIRERPEARAIFINGYLMVAALTSLYGIIIFVFETYDRATSTFYLANPFAGFLLAAIVIGLWRFAERSRLSDGLVTMINLSAFILADSRGAGLVLVAVIFLSLCLSRQMFRHWRRILIVLAGALALTLICNLGRAHISHHFTFQGARYGEVLEGQSNSLSDRVYYLRSALAIWAEKPLTGWGAGTYGTMHPQYQYRVISAGRDAHNFYVQSLAELGLVGFAIIAWLVVEILFGLWRGTKSDAEFTPLALAALALLMHFGLDIDASYPVLLVLAAGLIAFSYRPTAETIRQTSYEQLVVPLTLALSLILMVPVASLFRGSYNADTAKSWQDLGDYERAIGYYQKADRGLIYDPDWLTAEGVEYYSIASAGLDKTKDLNLASMKANIAIQQDPQDAQHYYLMGQVQALQGKTSEAVKDYQTAVRLDPYDNPQYYDSLAALYLQQSKLSLADQTASTVARLYTASVLSNRNYDTTLPAKVATGYTIRAVIAQKLGRVDIARTFVASALQVDPKNAQAKMLSQQIGQ